MQIGLIGCGRVGVTLFYLLKRNNRVIGVYDINRRNQNKAAQLLGIKNNPRYNDIINRCQALFLATPDDTICLAYERASKHIRGRKFVYHFSGLLPSDIIPKTKNVSRASVHPFATFPRIVIPPRRKYLISIEGDGSAVKAASDIFRPKYFTLRQIKKEQKIIYHLAGVFSSNLLVGLISSTYELARKLNWQEADIHQLIFPIIDETLINIKKHGLESALSGPLQRGDVDTIKKHLKALKKNKRLSNIYRDLSIYILQNITPDNKNRQLKKLLDP
jgi:predicted short-subunit dehydrogenase-like oxidoreductase (DUF2520 family)